MNWFIFALIPPVLWGLANVIDKFLISKIFDKLYIFTMWGGIFSIIACSLMTTFFNPVFLFPYSLICLASGVLWAIFNLIYARALLKDEVSRVISLIFTTPIFVTILAGLLLNEILSIPKYIGILLLVAGGLLISFRKEGKKFRIIDSIKWVLILIPMWSFIQIVEKILVERVGYWSLYFWVTLGFFIGALPFFIVRKTRLEFIKTVKGMGKRNIMAVSVSQTVTILGSISFYVAIFIGPLSMTSAISSLQPLFVFIFTILISIFIPRVLKEDMSRYNIFMKSLAIFLVLVGSWLLM